MNLSRGHSAHATAAPVERAFVRAGKGEPLVLLHGLTGSSRVWTKVVPLLAPHHDVIAPSALGHRGGDAPSVRPVRIAHVVDDTERMLDALRIERAHLAGNSLGGWVALELARRGRALSVCALSPAGAWPRGAQPSGKLRGIIRRARAFRHAMPLLALLPQVRHVALLDNACHGERVTREQLLGSIDDLLGCTVHEDLLDTAEVIEMLSAACPVTIAWGSHDRILPLEGYAAHARLLLPDAHFVILDDVGHVPMFDDPKLVADVILAAVARGRGGSTSIIGTHR